MVRYKRRSSSPPQLATDADTSVKSASELLDRLIKDIVTEVGKVDLARLMPLLKERIYTKSRTQTFALILTMTHSS